MKTSDMNAPRTLSPLDRLLADAQNALETVAGDGWSAVNGSGGTVQVVRTADVESAA